MTTEQDIVTANILQNKTYLINMLYTQYATYPIRNAAILSRLKKELHAYPRPIRVLYFVYIIDQVSYALVDALNARHEIDLVMCANTKQQLDYLKSKGLVTILAPHAAKLDQRYEHETRSFNPDICFCEMPYGALPLQEHLLDETMICQEWLPKYSQYFTRNTLNNSLFCFVHYAYFLAKKWGWLKADTSFNCHYCLPFQNFAWKYFLETTEHLEYALDENNSGNTSNYLVSGYPRYDLYFQENLTSKEFSWKFNSSDRKRIVYAPHFFRSNDSIESTCKILLELAETKKYEIVLKPHPVYNSIIDKYAQFFREHPSTQCVQNGSSSQYIFKTADILIIGSVSMHADALFSSTPFISDLSDDNFNHIGLKVKNVGYEMTDRTRLEDLIDNIILNDYKKHERENLLADLAPTRGNASKIIIDHILKELELELP